MPMKPKVNPNPNITLTQVVYNGLVYMLEAFEYVKHKDRRQEGQPKYHAGLTQFIHLAPMICLSLTLAIYDPSSNKHDCASGSAC